MKNLTDFILVLIGSDFLVCLDGTPTKIIHFVVNGEVSPRTQIIPHRDTHVFGC